MIPAKNYGEGKVYRLNYQARKGERSSLRRDQAGGSKVRNFKKRSSRPARYMIFWAVLVFFFAGIFILYVGQQVQVAKTQMKLDDMSKVLQKLEKENNYLKLQLAQKKSLKTIEERAREELGMVEPENVHFVYLDESNIQETKPKAAKNDNFFVKLSQSFTSFLRSFTVVRAGTID